MRLTKLVVSRINLVFCIVLFFSCNTNTATEKLNLEEINVSAPVSKDDPCDDGVFTNLNEALKSPDCVRELYIRGNNLKVLSNDLVVFRNLEIIDAGDNEIRILPGWLSELPNLKEIHLSYNLIDSLSPALSNCDSLSVLSLVENNLSFVPKWICELKELSEFNITNNPIVDIPDCIASIPTIQFILIESSLEKHDISNQRLRFLKRKCGTCTVMPLPTKS